ncbi:hypothetical protein [Anaeroselena agilis]|uniref:Uncharacterized protein n=1 Tax=Anaeroselena agilis TaxID=3063788 RepID=A0ABU3NVY9_9FIRM|nr:hypothetical protein [Selenomonadales bacterium 4137-cl]
MRGQRKDKRNRTVQPPRDVEGDDAVKLAKPVSKNKPLRMLKRIVSNPDFGYQCMVVLLGLTQNNVSMDRRIDTMSSSIETLRNITGVLTNATQSLKTAAEAPRQIRRLVKPGDG